MPAPPFIELGQDRHRVRIPILHEDRAVIAIDKPAGWLLVPFNWQRTQRNLQAALTSSIAAGDFWARSRNVRFLRPVHRLDGDTSGVLLLARSLGAVDTFSRLFESRRLHKVYLAVVQGTPPATSWSCEMPLSPEPNQPGRMRLGGRDAKPALTTFHVLHRSGPFTLVEALPLTGRTHQIRLHLVHAQLPVVGDSLYGPEPGSLPGPRERSRSIHEFPLALRAVELAYTDPFRRQRVVITAPRAEFLRAFGFEADSLATRPPKPNP